MCGNGVASDNCGAEQVSVCEFSECVDELVDVVDGFQCRGLGVSLGADGAYPDEEQPDLMDTAYYSGEVDTACSGVEGFLEGRAADRGCEGSANRALVNPVPD